MRLHVFEALLLQSCRALRSLCACVIGHRLYARLCQFECLYLQCCLFLLLQFSEAIRSLNLNTGILNRTCVFNDVGCFICLFLYTYTDMCIYILYHIHPHVYMHMYIYGRRNLNRQSCYFVSVASRSHLCHAWACVHACAYMCIYIYTTVCILYV